MVRNLIAAVAVFAFATGLVAGEYKGKLVKADTEKNTITISIGKKGEEAKEKTFKVAEKCKFVTVKPAPQKGEKPTEEALADGLKADAFKTSGKGGPNVTIITTGEGDKEEATEIKVMAAKKKKDSK